MINLRKAIALGLAAAALGLGVVVTSTPAAAWGGFHPHWRGGLGGFAAGAALGAAVPYSYGYPTCYFARQPVVDADGNIIGYRRVHICN
ncbi:MAG TPA: hypothetical protein VLZ74_05725 [Methylocella sp.]|nr:hypothetical protein [Methylocella sp.]